MFIGTTTGTVSGSAYAAMTTTMTVESPITIHEVHFYAAEARTYTLKIDGLPVGSPTDVAAGVVGVIDTGYHVLAAGAHEISVIPATPAKVNYRGAASILLLSEPEITLAVWGEFSDSYTIPFAFEITVGAVAPPAEGQKYLESITLVGVEMSEVLTGTECVVPLPEGAQAGDFIMVGMATAEGSGDSWSITADGGLTTINLLNIGWTNVFRTRSAPSFLTHDEVAHGEVRATNTGSAREVQMGVLVLRHVETATEASYGSTSGAGHMAGTNSAGLIVPVEGEHLLQIGGCSAGTEATYGSPTHDLLGRGDRLYFQMWSPSSGNRRPLPPLGVNGSNPGMGHAPSSHGEHLHACRYFLLRAVSSLVGGGGGVVPVTGQIWPRGDKAGVQVS